MEIKGFSDVVDCKTKSLKKISDLYGKKELQLFLTDIIGELSQFLNVGKNMNASQCLKTAELLIDKWPNIHLEDVKLCIQYGKAGDYGKNYDRLDGQVIMEWFEKYSLEKLEFIENRHEQLKQESSDLLTSWNGKFLEILRGLTINKPIEEPKERTPEYNAAHELANSWMKDFDRIHRQQYGGIGQSVRFVTINEKNYDITEYMNYRLEAHLINSKS